MGCIVSANALFFSTVSVGCLKIKNKEENKGKEGAKGNGIKGKGEKSLA